jgi:ABC-type protease/lipase transport system fused ATPase/permease subunit
VTVDKCDGQAFVEMRDYSAKWEEDTLEPTLDKICFRAEPGQLIAIIGPVGAGKVTLSIRGHIIPRRRYLRRSSARRTVWTAR